jgi:predicted small metal-binding protein
VKARELVIAPRLPPPPKHYGANPFATIADAVIDCDVPGCGWHAMGPRADLKKAFDEHYKQCHGADREIAVVLINQPRQ